MAAKVAFFKDNFFTIVPEFYSLQHLCATAPFPKLLNYLLESQDLYTMDVYGKTPLTYAIESGHTESVKVIIDYFREFPEGFVVNHIDIRNILEMGTAASAELFEIAFNEHPEELISQKTGYLRNNPTVLTSE